MRRTWPGSDSPLNPTELGGPSPVASSGAGGHGTPTTPACTQEEWEDTDTDPHEVEMLMSAQDAHPVALVCKCGARALISWEG